MIRLADIDEHPLDCEGCPDCVPFWAVDVEPDRDVPGFTTENRRRRERELAREAARA